MVSEVLFLRWTVLQEIVVAWKPASEMESLRSFVSFSGGELSKDTKMRKRRLEETKGAGNRGEK